MSERMIFCVGEGIRENKGAGYQKNLQIFNTPVSEDKFNEIWQLLKTKNTKLPIATWIKVEDIKKPTASQKQLGGYLKIFSYKDAWKEYWATATQEDANFFLQLPHFDHTIFEKITGITKEDFDAKLGQTLIGKKAKVIIDGKEYNVTIDS